MAIHQLRSTDGTGTLTYFVIDDASKRCGIIDPNQTDNARIAAFVTERGLTVSHIIDTHTHADHVTGAGDLRARFGATVVMHEKTKGKWKLVEQGDRFGIGDTLRANAEVPVDLYVNEGDSIAIGGASLLVLYTPGHTDNHIALRTGDALFTGDLLLAGQAGRSDLPGGDAGAQYDTLFAKILPLPDATKIFPGHDYADHEFVLLGDERRTNPFLAKRTRAEYLAFVTDFFPPLAESGPGGHVTLQCGTARVMSPDEPFKNMSPKELSDLLTARVPLVLLDVREPVELVMEGAIPGVVNIPTSAFGARLAELPRDKNARIVVVCRTGSRSQEVSHYLAARMGFTNVFNLEGGTMAWIRAGLNVERAGRKV